MPKKILLIGDSIRMSYIPRVKEKLQDIADVVGPEENCRFVKYTLWEFAGWVSVLGKPDVIHWNNGIWDAYHLNAEVGIFTSIDEYVTDLRRVLKEMRKTGAKIIWATTTAVSDQCIPCSNAEIDQYNAAALRLMQAEGIEINDLNRVIKQNLVGYLIEDGIHLTAEGIEVCAEACVKAVSPYIS